jgi:hypothetical protein
MIYLIPANPLAFPLMIIISAIDLYVFAASLRFTLGQLSATRTGTACRALQELVDPLPCRLDMWLTRWCGRPSPAWLSWLIVIGAGLAARQLLASILLSGFRT